MSQTYHRNAKTDRQTDTICAYPNVFPPGLPTTISIMQYTMREGGDGGGGGGGGKGLDPVGGSQTDQQTESIN